MSMSPDVLKSFAAAMNQGSPQARALGIETVGFETDVAILKIAYKPELVGDPDTGVIAGGVVTTLLDHSCGQAVHSAQREPSIIATLDLRIDYMRAAEPGKDIYCRAHCYKITRSVAFVRASAYDDHPDDPVATAQAAFMLNSSAGRPDGRQLEAFEGQSVSAANDQLQAMIGRIPYARFLGVRVELAGDEMTAILPYSEHLIGNPTLPALHGGVLGAFMELTALAQISIAQASGGEGMARQPKPIDVTVEYLRSGRPLDTFARASITRMGRRIANVRVEAWQEVRASPIAALHGHFLVTPAEDAAA